MISNLLSISGEVSSRFYSSIIEILFYSTILFIIILVLAALLRKKSPLWHLGLWTLVLVRLVLPPGISIPVTKPNILHNAAFLNELKEFIPEFKSKELKDLHLDTILVSPIQTANVSTAETPISDRVSGTFSVPVWKFGIFFFWLLGFFITLTIHIKKYLYFHRVVIDAALIQNEKFSKILVRLRRVFRIKRNIRIVSSNQCLSPFTIGILKPVIYLPQNLIESGDDELLNSVLSHEIAHIKHFDDFWMKFQNFIQSVYFFYPVVWYVNSRIHLSRECLRDSLVISKGKIPPKVLGKGILTLIRMNSVGSDRFLYLPGFGNEKKKAFYRLRNLKSNRVLIYQKIYIYVFIVVLGAFFIPLFASIDSSETIAKIEKTEESSSLPVQSFEEITSDSILQEVKDRKIKMLNKSPASPKVKIPRRQEIVESSPDQGTLQEKTPGVSVEETEKIVLNGISGNEDDTPLLIDEQYIPPKLTKKVKPVYPFKARLGHVSGMVVLEATTDTSGRVIHVKVLRSISVLDQAAIDAVRQWIYEPMVINGRLRAVIFKVNVIFELE